MIEEAKEVIGKQLGPFKGWQWALIGGVPLGLWIFLSNRSKGDSSAEESPNPQPVGGATNAVYGPGDMAILARLQELATVSPGGGNNGNSIPMANLSLLGINLERAAAQSKFATNRSQLLNWAGLILDMVSGRSEYDQEVIDQIVNFMKVAGIPLDTLLQEDTPTNPPPTNPPPTNPPPTNLPTNPPPTNPPPTSASWIEGQVLLQAAHVQGTSIPDQRLRLEYIGLVDNLYGEINRAVKAGTMTPAEGTAKFKRLSDQWLYAAKN